MTRLDERVETEVMREHRFDRRLEHRTGDPVVVGKVLQHGPNASKLRMPGERGQPWRRVRRLQIHPPHDCADEVILRRKIEQILDVFMRGQGLDEHGSLHVELREQRSKVLGSEILVDGVERWRRPGASALRDLPEVLVRIDPERHAQTSGTGADSASKPSRCNACQSWSGMGVSSHSMFLFN